VSRSTEPLQFNWLLSERSQHFELGRMLQCAVDLDGFAPRGRQAGWWECNLADSSLIWSDGVFDLFGFERGSPVTREQALVRYTEHSRAALERLRADAVRHGLGFTLDAELKPFDGASRWVRIVAAPDLSDGKVVQLHGLKFAI
jgi:hypothetical protein